MTQVHRAKSDVGDTPVNSYPVDEALGKPLATLTVLGDARGALDGIRDGLVVH